MSSGYIGSPAGNSIIPVSNLMKQTKWLNITDTSHLVPAADNTTSLTIAYGYIMAYADSNGVWRLRFNISMNGTSAGDKATGSLTFASTYTVAFAAGQAISGYATVGTSAVQAWGNAFTASLLLTHASAAVVGWRFSGDVALASEPTWAAANMENAQPIAAYIPSAGASTAGLVDTAAQTFAGVKTFSDGVAMAATKGISFAANSNAAGMTSELLNWYEEGTWTPTVRGTSTAGTYTYNQRYGYYTRIGRMVFVCCFLDWATSGSDGSGNLQIDGLPYTSNGNTYVCGLPTLNGMTAPAGTIVALRINGNTTAVVGYAEPVGGGTGAALAIDHTAGVAFSIMYMI